MQSRVQISSIAMHTTAEAMETAIREEAQRRRFLSMNRAARPQPGAVASKVKPCIPRYCGGVKHSY